MGLGPGFVNIRKLREGIKHREIEWGSRLIIFNYEVPNDLFRIIKRLSGAKLKDLVELIKLKYLVELIVTL